MTKPTLSTYGGALRDIGYAGGLVDLSGAFIESRIQESATPLEFGAAVARGATAMGCAVPASVAALIIGFAVRNAVYAADEDGNVNFPQNRMVPVYRGGGSPIFALAAEDAAAGDFVSVLTTANTLGSASGDALATRVVAAAVALGTNTGNGVFGTATADAGADLGDYDIVFIEPASGLGTFLVYKPDGTIDGDGVVGTAYNGSINFTIADGATDFIAGDAFTVSVSVAARITLNGLGGNIKAIWDDAVLAASLGKIRILG